MDRKNRSCCCNKNTSNNEKIKSWEKITNIGKTIQKKLKKLAKKYDLKINVAGLPALTSFNFNSLNNSKYKTLITQEMLKQNFLASNLIYVCTEHNDNVVNEYFFYLEKIFKQIKECEDGRDINKILETPVSYSGFKRLN